MTKERPILFNSQMVCAILAGTKTQTRRPMKVQPDGQPVRDPSDGKWYVNGGLWLASPPALVGDVLWVRETLRRDPVSDSWSYGADGVPVTLEQGDPNVSSMLSWAHHNENDVCVSIHMPKWAARIRLEVTDVRVERLWSITEEDARAEGITDTDLIREKLPSARDAFARIWRDVYGHVSWDCNEWVWALTFRRL